MFENIFHADWSKHEKKRWFVAATRQNKGWRVRVPENTGTPAQFLNKILPTGRDSKTLAGFDFPIGIPLTVGEKLKLDSFPDALSEFGKGLWKDFFEVSSHRSEISISKPFYPYRPGGTRMAHLVEGLSLSSKDDLLRVVKENPHQGRQLRHYFGRWVPSRLAKQLFPAGRRLLSPQDTEVSSFGHLTEV